MMECKGFAWEGEDLSIVKLCLCDGGERRDRAFMFRGGKEARSRFYFSRGKRGAIAFLFFEGEKRRDRAVQLTGY
jgi:hypothetical protein